MTPLAYSIPGFGQSAFADARPALDDLRSLGFHWVTVTPTWLVIDSVPMRIDFARSPRLDNIAKTIEYARSLGMSIRLEPHLDWESTLTGGMYEWRRRMYFDPQAEYFEHLLAPLLALHPDELTLGSELDAAWLAFAQSWRAVREKVWADGVNAGHKLNHDALEAGAELTRLVNGERARLGLAPWDHEDYENARMEANLYLSELDYVSFSFYPPVKNGDYQGSISKAARHCEAALRAAAGFDPQMAIGEFGLGSDDITRPWHFDRTTFFNSNGTLNEGAFERRREFYLNFLACLRSQTILSSSPASFWTVDQYDFLGSLDYKDADLFRDEILRSAISQYNREAHGDSTIPLRPAS